VSATSWLGTRAPAPPPPLVAALGDLPDQPAPRALAAAGLARLRAALALGDVRPAAYQLLAADALLTYAVERAVELGDAELQSLLAELGPDVFARLLEEP
jgi:hypothetical protein